MNDQEISNKSRLTLERRHQLIDLNKEYVNFDITFECRAIDATKDFEIIVVNQEQLNTIDLSNLTMKMTKNGYISGNIIADEDKYQNYFLILRSPTDEPIEVDLEIKIKQIAAKNTDAELPLPQQPLPPSHLSPDAMMPYSDPTINDDVVTCQSSSGFKQSHLFFIVIGLMIIGGAAAYYFWKNSKKTNGACLAIEDDARSVYSEHSSCSGSSASSDDRGILDTLIKKSKN